MPSICHGPSTDVRAEADYCYNILLLPFVYIYVCTVANYVATIHR